MISTPADGNPVAQFFHDVFDIQLHSLQAIVLVGPRSLLCTVQR
jgi:hypothetical protein